MNDKNSRIQELEQIIAEQQSYIARLKWENEQLKACVKTVNSEFDQNGR